ncbi:MAG: hypothetical protein R6V35_03920 [Candidatus Nanohaloarchaea archaeon]
MKGITLILALTVFISMVSASIGTFTGDLKQEGPEAEFIVGIASDKPLKVEIDVPEREGLNITYNQSFRFDPNNEDRVYQRGSTSLPVREYQISVESVDVTQETYSIPVNFKAYPESKNAGTSPRVIQERVYMFNYVTDLSPNHGWDGSLIDNGDNSVSNNEDQNKSSGADETLDLGNNSENSLTEGNQTDDVRVENSTDRTTQILLGLILLLSIYILKEGLK